MGSREMSMRAIDGSSDFIAAVLGRDAAKGAGASRTDVVKATFLTASSVISCKR
jgi:hypothetical protein